ncbi:MAG TPA: two-component sensor histidine kinase [Cyanobacteria bacterium UBA8803]|nr:two-component sensor histidine kinase [Cyanobacteria bacterium UBA9273]HBL60948.1 two-component sensor histidine kinase [Cyanobacteria bacterium UBA8803]
MSEKISDTTNTPNGNLKNTNISLPWRKFFFGARTRILAWYILLVSLSTTVTILAIRQSLLSRLEERIDESLVQEIEEFRRLVEGHNPRTGQPFGDDVKSIFSVYLSRNIPNDDEFLITLCKNEFYKASPRALPDPIDRDSELVKYWANLTKAERGEKLMAAGKLFYIAEPVQMRGETLGVFVVVNLLSGELDEINEAVTVIAQIAITVLVVASVLAWLTAGRVLAPLRSLTEIARSINESDLTGRIPVRGKDEIAELTITFNQMLDRLEAGFLSQRNFMNDAGHELRTPIAIIQGHLELMDDDPQEQQETLAIVFDELDRMNRLVNDLLLLAKTEQSNFLNLETVEIETLTQELYTKAKALGARDWRLEATGSGFLTVDRQRITQAVMNLAQNATQHTQEGDEIGIGSAISAEQAYFWVRDTGVGIPLAEQSQIFERFVRGSRRRRCEGTGLGLAIVRAIAQSHGGRVELKSQLGEGAAFTIVIPVKSVSLIR